MEGFSAHVPHVVVAPPATWTKQSRTGETDGPFQQEGLGIAVGGGEEQRHRVAKEACTVDQALFAGQAPGTSATLNELRDPERRPSRLSETIPLEISRFWPQHQFQLDKGKFARFAACMWIYTEAVLCDGQESTQEYLKRRP